jgi:hypothetical protein
VAASIGELVPQIENEEFTLFWDLDRDKLAAVSFLGRAAWLRARITMVLLVPLDALEKAGGSASSWLATTELVCAGIVALGQFYGGGKNGRNTPFCRFVDAFMHGDFSKRALDHNGNARSYCEHLQQYFRNGLDHGFAVEWGRLWMANEPDASGYLRPNPSGDGIAVCPQMLLEDFREAVDKYFARLLREGENSLMGRSFGERFENIRTQKIRS